MIRLIRIFGFLMMATGAVILLSYLIPPLRALWPFFLKLPLPIQIGLGAAAIGFLLLLATLLWERWEEREDDRKLREDL
jgi:membrane protein implicated in regulation of membrane protease activity